MAKVKMGSIIGHRKDYRLLWGRGSERPAAHTQQKLTQVQSNLSNTDTEGTEQSVRIREVSVLERSRRLRHF